MTADYVPMTADQRANVQSIIDRLTKVGEATGGWTSKVDARQTGASIHARFTNRVDAFTAMEWANLLEQCPAMLTSACQKYLAADAEVSALGRRFRPLALNESFMDRATGDTWLWTGDEFVRTPDADVPPEGDLS